MTPFESVPSSVPELQLLMVALVMPPPETMRPPAKVEEAVVEVAKRRAAPRMGVSTPEAKVEVAVEVAVREPTESGAKESARLYEPVPPSAVAPEPVILEPEPKVILELASVAFEMEPAGSETVEVAVKEPTESVPTDVDERYAWTP